MLTNPFFRTMKLLRRLSNSLLSPTIPRDHYIDVTIEFDILIGKYDDIFSKDNEKIAKLFTSPFPSTPSF